MAPTIISQHASPSKNGLTNSMASVRQPWQIIFVGLPGSNSWPSSDALVVRSSSSSLEFFPFSGVHRCSLAFDRSVEKKNLFLGLDLLVRFFKAAFDTKCLARFGSEASAEATIAGWKRATKLKVKSHPLRLNGHLAICYLNTEMKQHCARRPLGWETAWELLVLLTWVRIPALIRC